MPKEVHVAEPAQVKIDLGGQLKFQGDVTEVCRINPDLLTDEIVEHPGTFAWFGVLSAAATKAAAEAEDNLKTVTSDMYQTLRDEAEKAGVKTTEEKLKQAVNGTERVIAARDKVNAANYDADVAKNLFEVMKQRKDLLLALANDRRSETRNL